MVSNVPPPDPTEWMLSPCSPFLQLWIRKIIPMRRWRSVYRYFPSTYGWFTRTAHGIIKIRRFLSLYHWNNMAILASLLPVFFQYNHCLDWGSRSHPRDCRSLRCTRRVRCRLATGGESGKSAGKKIFTLYFTLWIIAYPHPPRSQPKMQHSESRKK